MRAEWTKSIVQPFTGKKIPAYLHGVIAPMFTPANTDGTIDDGGTCAWIDYLIDTGAITTLFPRCGLGRMYQFSYAEVKQIIDVTVSHAGDRIPVMPGTMGEWHNDLKNRPDPKVFTRQSIELSQYAQSMGAVAVVLVLPSALAPKDGVPLEDTIYEYFAAVASEIDLPIVIYQPPGLDSKYLMTPSLLKRLLEIKNIAGMKYSSGDLPRLSRLAMVARGTNFALIAGDELAFLYTMILGASGVIGQGSTMNPETLRAVYDRMMARDIEGAREAQFDCVRAIDIAEGLDIPTAGLMYAALKGIKVQPYTKMDAKPIYGGPSGVSISDETIARFAREMDALRGKYQ